MHGNMPNQNMKNVEESGRKDSAMAFEHNIPHIVNPVVDGLRDISARRASTISNMIDEAAKRGLDDQFAYDAVWTYGADNGKEYAQSLGDHPTFRQFADGFGTDHNKDIYEMERVVDDDDELEIHFHYCPYVTEWVKQGKTPDQISRLCEIAMAGDHAFAKEFDCLDFALEGTIADGKDVCTLRFTRRKESDGFIKTDKH